MDNIEKTNKLKKLFDQAMDLVFGSPEVEEPEEDKSISDPTKQEKDNGFIVLKELDGTARWFAWVTNQWQDSEGHILTNSAHREFEAYLDANPDEAPELWIWHTVGTAKTNRADWWHYSDGFFMYSGVLTPEEAEAYANVNAEDIGMSHGFKVLVYDFENKYILKYRTFEVSELPRNRAANPFTSFTAIKEMQKTMFDNPTKRNYLVTRLGEEKVQSLEQDTEGAAKALDLMGINMKELDEEIAKVEKAAFDERVTAAVIKATEAQTKAIAESIVKAMNPEGLQATIVAIQEKQAEHDRLLKEIATLRENVDYLKQTDDARMAALIAPVMPRSWGNSVQKGGNEDAVEPVTPELSDDLAVQVNAVKSGGKNTWLANMISLQPGG